MRMEVKPIGVLVFRNEENGKLLGQFFSSDKQRPAVSEQTELGLLEVFPLELIGLATFLNLEPFKKNGTEEELAYALMEAFTHKVLLRKSHRLPSNLAVDANSLLAEIDEDGSRKRFFFFGMKPARTVVTVYTEYVKGGR